MTNQIGVLVASFREFCRNEFDLCKRQTPADELNLKSKLAEFCSQRNLAIGSEEIEVLGSFPYVLPMVQKAIHISGSKDRLSGAALADFVFSDDFILLIPVLLRVAYPAAIINTYVHVPKTGGTSIEQHMFDCGVSMVWRPDELKQWQRNTGVGAPLVVLHELILEYERKGRIWLSGHVTLSFLHQNDLINQGRDNFIVIRDPFGALLSAVNYHIELLLSEQIPAEINGRLCQVLISALKAADGIKSMEPVILKEVLEDPLFHYLYSNMLTESLFGEVPDSVHLLLQMCEKSGITVIQSVPLYHEFSKSVLQLEERPMPWANSSVKHIGSLNCLNPYYFDRVVNRYLGKDILYHAILMRRIGHGH